jgi:hypothetical protein
MKNSIIFITSSIIGGLIMGLLIVSCVCGCGNKFYQVNYKDGKVEYYSNSDIDRQGYSGTDGYLKLIIRDTAGNKLFERTISAELIQSLDEIEGDMPTDNKPIVKKDTTKLPDNIKMK